MTWIPNERVGRGLEGKRKRGHRREGEGREGKGKEGKDRGAVQFFLPPGAADVVTPLK